MLDLLITGTQGYIGNRLKEHLRNEPDRYKVHTLDVRDNQWQACGFSRHDVVLHLAGLVHTKETRQNKDLFFKVNRDLTFQLAKRVKAAGVKQFIFLSSMSVYGLETGIIGPNTQPEPHTAYGQSKYEAEIELKSLEDESFIVAILRPPMVYGMNCKGNYARLRELAIKAPFFPEYPNRRSMLYIENLIEYLKHIMDEKKTGLFFPQNPDYVSTLDMVRQIAEEHGKVIRTTQFFNPLLRSLRTGTLNKLFGDLVYDQSLSPHASRFAVCSFEESIHRSEGCL